MEHLRWITVAGVLGIAVLAGAWFGSRAPEPPPVSIARGVAPERVPDEPRITVHVSGAVAHPGLVVLDSAARVADALAAAGGVQPGADLTALNLAAPMQDGEQVVVPARGDPPASRSAGHSGDGRIHLNRADARDLEDLPGIGPVTAQRIVDYRTANGPFTTVEDLLGVPGIGEGKLAALRDSVVVP